MKIYSITFGILLVLIISSCKALHQVATPTLASTQTPSMIATLPTSTSKPTAHPLPLVSDTPTPKQQIITTEISSTDNMTLVYVPAGDFLMGSLNSDPQASSDEIPQHTVYLDAYWIDRIDVTNGMYSKCVEAGFCHLPSNIYTRLHGQYYGNLQFSDYPVIFVSWNDAQTYCKWAGRRLPTEAEWEKAARGTDARIYPWGNTKPDCSFANFGGLVDGCVGGTSKVDAYPEGASPYGVLDMAGNVGQWVADWYDANYYTISPRNSPAGPDAGSGHVIRGGSWVLIENGIRSASRFWLHTDPVDGSQWVGFRCVLSR